jgi:hypothetical protein
MRKLFVFLALVGFGTLASAQTAFLPPASPWVKRGVLQTYWQSNGQLIVCCLPSEVKCCTVYGLSAPNRVELSQNDKTVAAYTYSDMLIGSRVNNGRTEDMLYFNNARIK